MFGVEARLNELMEKLSDKETKNIELSSAKEWLQVEHLTSKSSDAVWSTKATRRLTTIVDALQKGKSAMGQMRASELIAFFAQNHQDYHFRVQYKNDCAISVYWMTTAQKMRWERYDQHAPCIVLS